MLEIVPIPPSESEIVDAGITTDFRSRRTLAEIWQAIKDRYYDWQWRGYA